jgi:hypothetical protein
MSRWRWRLSKSESALKAVAARTLRAAYSKSRGSEIDRCGSRRNRRDQWERRLLMKAVGPPIVDLVESPIDAKPISIGSGWPLIMYCLVIDGGHLGFCGRPIAIAFPDDVDRQGPAPNIFLHYMHRDFRRRVPADVSANNTKAPMSVLIVRPSKGRTTHSTRLYVKSIGPHAQLMLSLTPSAAIRLNARSSPAPGSSCAARTTRSSPSLRPSPRR